MDREYLRTAVSQLAAHHVLVVGDLFLDEYLIGQALRLSREAPIPVLKTPRIYNSAQTSGLTADIQAGRNDNVNFELTTPTRRK